MAARCRAFLDRSIRNLEICRRRQRSWNHKSASKMFFGSLVSGRLTSSNDGTRIGPWGGRVSGTSYIFRGHCYRPSEGLGKGRPSQSVFRFPVCQAIGETADRRHPGGSQAQSTLVPLLDQNSACPLMTDPAPANVALVTDLASAPR